MMNGQTRKMVTELKDVHIFLGHLWRIGKKVLGQINEWI